MGVVGNIPNLWPENISVEYTITPKAILSRQAMVITEKTKEHVQGKVETKVLGRDFTHSLCLVAPKLDNFTQFVLRVRHSIEHTYPVYVFLSENSDTSKECADEAALYALIRAQLGSELILHMVQSLIAQSDIV